MHRGRDYQWTQYDDISPSLTRPAKAQRSQKENPKWININKAQGIGDTRQQCRLPVQQTQRRTVTAYQEGEINILQDT